MLRPKIVTLCGSTKFKDAFTEHQLKETLDGKLVLTIGCNMNSDSEIFGHLSVIELRGIKAKLDVLHFHKIAISDEILVLNIGGYIGESTEREIENAKSIGVTVRYLDGEPRLERSATEPPNKE